MNKQHQFKMQRRGFLETLSAGAAAMGFSMLTSPLRAAEKSFSFPGSENPDEWFKQIKGKHRIVFDADKPKGILTFAFPRVYLLTNASTGTPEKDCSVVLILRHDAIPYALESRLWEKYKLGEVFEVVDPATNAPSLRNPYWQPKPGDFKVPGVGEVAIGINELQDSGILFCACNMALTVNSAGVAAKMNKDAEEVKKDWMSGLLPNIHIVPSGVWAVNRAQEHGCSYCFAG